jgi:hypothetical protein
MKGGRLLCLLASGVPLLGGACSGHTHAGTTGGGSDGVGATDGSAGGTAGASTAGGVSGNAGGTAEVETAGAAGAGAAPSGDVAGAGGDSSANGRGGTGVGGTTYVSTGPCDIYRDAGQPCVAAYSTVRRISSTYTGPLYQIRSGSSAENTGAGGQLHDVVQTAEGFADTATVDEACADTICTIAALYDQSGNANHLAVAKKGIQAGGPNANLDDFESSATPEPLIVRGHAVYPLSMEARQGYRLGREGDGVPRSSEPQGIYMLADGTHAGVGCCWEFGNGPRDAETFYDSTALLYGSGVTSAGDRMGDGPWFMADFHLSIWASASPPEAPVTANPSLAVKFGLAFLKSNATNFALRMADAGSASTLTTSYQGLLPRRIYLGGGVLLGINADNSNASSGTFYEGAIVAGFPADVTELAVMRNVQAVGYGKSTD